MKMLLVKFCLVAEITEGGREREKGSVSLFCFWILGANGAFFFFFCLAKFCLVLRENIDEKK